MNSRYAVGYFNNTVLHYLQLLTSIKWWSASPVASRTPLLPTVPRPGITLPVTPPPDLPEALAACWLVSIQRDDPVPPLLALYESRYRVLRFSPQHSTIQIGERGNSLYGLKTCNDKTASSVQPLHHGRPPGPRRVCCDLVAIGINLSPPPAETFCRTSNLRLVCL
jgi:hypothetical protein